MGEGKLGVGLFPFTCTPDALEGSQTDSGTSENAAVLKLENLKLFGIKDGNYFLFLDYFSDIQIISNHRIEAKVF